MWPLGSAVVRVLAVTTVEPVLPLHIGQMHQARSVVRKELLELKIDRLLNLASMVLVLRVRTYSPIHYYASA